MDKIFIHGWSYEDQTNTPILAGATAQPLDSNPVPQSNALLLFAIGAAGICEPS